MGACSYLYVLYFSYFAELHISIAGLDVPFFIGEILLGLCLALLFAKALLGGCMRQASSRFYLLTAAYLIFVVSKALVGYYRWGPLSFRHAALFYYPLFAFIGYHFYDRRIFSMPLVFIMLVALIFAASKRIIYVYYTFPSLVLGLVLCGALKPAWLKAAFAALFLSVFPYRDFFDRGRTRILGNAAGLLTFFVSFLHISFKSLSRRAKLAVTLCLAVCLVLVITKAADKNALRSLVSWKENFGYWRQRIQQVDCMKRSFQFAAIPVRIYAQNALAKGRPLAAPCCDEKGYPIQLESIAATSPASLFSAPAPNAGHPPPQPRPYRCSECPPVIRSLEEANNNILFRILIWRDMLLDMGPQAWLWGIDFGYPFRSRSLEILKWGDDAWGKDGWVAAHNSYLEMVYRAGAVGVMLVAFTIFVFFGLLRFFIRVRSLTGLMLMSVFVFWLAVANFTVFFELPYTAINFWLLLGMTMAYRSDLERARGDA